MSKTASPTIDDPTETYYECIPCGYTARVDQAIGLCPRCGDDLTYLD
jgi:rubrerythrin